MRVHAARRDAHAVHGYLAGADDARAEDFSTAWCDPDVRAVVCATGGYGAQRMVDHVDWAALRGADPTVLVGFSDVTALHQAVATQLGVSTLHGPMSATQSFVGSVAAELHLRATLLDPESVRVLSAPTAHAVVGGRATGVTTGGCLSVLTTSVATTSFGGTRGGLVLLEDVDEKAYRLDSYLTHLRRSGWFDGATGIVLGSWADCEPAEPVVVDVLGDLGVPILGELGFGHGPTPSPCRSACGPTSTPMPAPSRWTCRRSPEPGQCGHSPVRNGSYGGGMTETFHQRHLAGARFEQVDLTGATFQQVYLKDVVFRDVDISGMRIRGAFGLRRRHQRRARERACPGHRCDPVDRGRARPSSPGAAQAPPHRRRRFPRGVGP